jgi:hypothetical protein
MSEQPALRPLRSLRREPTSTPAVPPPPAGLSARGRKRWRELWEEYGFSLAAGDQLAQALVALDVAEECGRQIRKAGVLVEGRYAGVPRAHPLLAVQRDSVRTAERLYRALGLNMADEGHGVPGGRAPRAGVPRTPEVPAPPARGAGLLRAVGDEGGEGE